MYYNFNQYINLGACIEKNGCNFAIYLKEIKTLSLNIFYSSEDTVPYERYILNPSEHRLGNIWSIFLENIKEGTLYNWEINGVPILDPYALAYTGNETIENRKSIVLARVGTETKHILIPKKDMVIYESHIGLFTKSPSSNTLNPATFSAFEEKIPYLKNLGINVVEFLPVFEWDDYTGNLDRESFFLKNVWGYNPINFFALTKKYSSSNNEDSANEINEFKKLVSSLHKNGIEVVLDVVYNHTAEGGVGGKTYNFKAMGEDIFYTKDKENNFINFSGCGNTLNCNHKVVKDMIIQSLLYWYLEVGVDGFRFDLMGLHDVATMNAIRSAMDDIDPRILIYGEGWDMGIGLPVDQKAKKDNAALMPRIGFFNDNARDAVKGAEVYGHISNGYVSGAPLEDKIAKSLLGSRGFVNYLMPGQVLNYIEAHDNYNLNDLMHHLHPHDLSEDIEKRIYLANALNLTMQGMCFMQLGQEFQRSKMVATGEDGNYTEADVQRAMNSYNAPDEVNRVDWNQVTLKKELVDKIAKLIERKKTVAEFSYRSYADIYDNLYVTKADFASGIVELHISGKLDETLVFDNMKKDLEIY